MQIKKLSASAVAWLLLVPIFVSLFYAGGVVAASSLTLDETSWTKGIIDSDSDVSYDLCQAIDSNGYLHVSYYNTIETDLMYATNMNGEWETMIVDSVDSVGRFNSITVDESGGIHISYYDWTNQDLKYATWDGDSWVISIVDSIGVVGEYNSIACDSEGVYITYLDYSNGALKCAMNTGDGWTTSVVAESVGFGSSLLVNDGVIEVVYTSSDDYLMYAYGNGTAWTTQVVDSTSAFGSDMDIDIVNGKVCVAYYEDTTTAHTLKYAVRSTTGVWATSVVDNTTDVRQGPSMDVDSNGIVHITYYDFVNGYLCYAVLDDDWSCSILDESGGMSSALVSDYNDKQHIVYIDQAGSSSQLTYITNSGAIWVSEVVAETDDSDMMSSIAVDSKGVVSIAYYDVYVEENVTKGRLAYAVTDGDGWDVEVIDNSSADVGMNPCIALDAEGNVHISYYDALSKNLKYATNKGGNWTTETLVESGDVGMYSAMVVTVNGSVLIAYMNEGAGTLKFINYTSGDSVIGTIDSGLTAVTEVAISLDSNGSVHVAYYHNGALVHSVLNGTEWDPEEIESSDQLGKGISMYIDEQDRVYITYYNAFSKTLRYTNNVNGSWSTNVIDVNAGIDSAISIDEDGEEHITYVDNSGFLRFAEMRDGIWMYQKVIVGTIGNVFSMATDSEGREHVSYFDAAEGALGYVTSLTVPSAPLNVTIEIDDTALTLRWEAPENDGGASIAAYEIYRSNGSSDLVLIGTVSKTTTTYLDSGLTNGVTYTYRIRAVNSEGRSALSDAVEGIPCTLPGIVAVEAYGQDGAVKLKWSAPDNGGADITSYNIYRKNENSVYVLLTTVSGTTTQYIDEGLENGVEYSYYITAVNPAGEGPDSAMVSATPNADSLILIVIVAIVIVAAIGAAAFVLHKRGMF